MTIATFRKIVWKHYQEHGRHDLPWRKTKDPYRILVSEIMLQQTQVNRVKSFYMVWLKKFPILQTLASASLGDVLRQWQGLGYNRRAKMLHTAAQDIVKQYKGRMPQTVQELEALPGIGHYTARAIMAFAHNEDVVFVETNLRAAVLHHFFSHQDAEHQGTKISDTEILAILEKALVIGCAREWYAALMDYGSYLKATGVRTNHRSKNYTKQSKFEGSDRQVRGKILRELSKGSVSQKKLELLFGHDHVSQVQTQIKKLEREHMISRFRTNYSLPK